MRERERREGERRGRDARERERGREGGTIWGVRVEKPSPWIIVFKYFRQFKIKHGPSLYCYFRSEALQ